MCVYIQSHEKKVMCAHAQRSACVRIKYSHINMLEGVNHEAACKLAHDSAQVLVQGISLEKL